MSEMELWKGTIKKIDVPEMSIEEQIKHLESNGYCVDYDIDDEQLYTYRGSEVHYNNENKTWWDKRNLEQTEESYDDIQEYSVNGDIVNVICQFYNGGSCISEQLDEITSKDLSGNNETVTITKERLEELEQSELKLECLEGCGVDNWCGYDDAMEMMEQYEEDEN